MKRFLAAISLGAFVVLTPAAAKGVGYAKQSEESAKVGEAYIAAYIGLDWDRIEPLLADHATFHDPTAEVLFRAAPKGGRDSIMKAFREGYADISNMMLHRSRTFYSGNYTVFEGDLEWGLRLPDGRTIQTRAPFIAILRIENGKVIEHRDYVDYAPFLKSERASRPIKDRQP